MDYRQFYQHFGGSYRTKHLQHQRSKPLARLFRSRKENKREFCLPPTSGLPKDFIRLEPWEGEYLFLVASRARIGIVEVGRFHGGSTFLFACANGQVPIQSIDIEPQNDKQLAGFLSANKVGSNVELIVGDSQHTEYPDIEAYDLLFIDGDHSYDGCLSDLKNWYDKVSPGGHIILHDCYQGCPTQQAVLDFTSDRHIEWLRSPYIIGTHWQTSEGSLCHFVKPKNSARAAA